MSGHTNILMLAHMLLIMLFLLVLMALLPRFMRGDIFFGVTVAPGFAATDAGRKILRRYYLRVLLIGGLLVVLTAAGTIALASEAALAFAPVAIIGVTIWAYLSARSSTLPHAAAPSTVREVSLAPRKLPGLPYHIGPIVILALATTWLAANWSSLPDPMPVHFNAAGVPDRFAPKSFWSVFGLPVIGLVVCGLMLLLGWSMRHARRVRATGPTAEHESGMMHLSLSILLIVEYFIALLFSTLAIAGTIRPAEAAGRWIAIIAIGGTSLMFFAIVALIWRGARRRSAIAGGIPVGDGTPDACWKWGMVYYNPDDPALWVEKRFGIGYTTNMAHPGAWALLGGILVAIATTVIIAILAG